MSYDIKIQDRNGNIVTFPEKHSIAGGTRCAGGTDVAWLNVTYNYADFFYKYIDDNKGIRAIYGKSLEEAMPMLDRAIDALGDAEPSENYWLKTQGNAKAALVNLRELARIARSYFPRKKMFWSGD